MPHTILRTLPYPADQFQPYLGQSPGACQTCNASADPRYTSSAGDDYCLVEWVDTVCINGAPAQPAALPGH